MLEEGAEKYVGKRCTWKGREIEIIRFYSCYVGDFYEYYYTDDIEKKVYTISIYDSELMKVL